MQHGLHAAVSPPLLPWFGDTVHDSTCILMRQNQFSAGEIFVIAPRGLFERVAVAAFWQRRGLWAVLQRWKVAVFVHVDTRPPESADEALSAYVKTRRTGERFLI